MWVQYYLSRAWLKAHWWPGKPACARETTVCLEVRFPNNQNIWVSSWDHKLYFLLLGSCFKSWLSNWFWLWLSSKLIVIDIIIIIKLIIISTSLADDEEKDNMGLVLEEGGGAGELLWHLHYHNQNHCLFECSYKKRTYESTFNIFFASPAFRKILLTCQCSHLTNVVNVVLLM